MTGTGRIDTHQHVLPPDYRGVLTDRGLNPGGIPLPQWSVEGAVDVMGRNGIATGIMSVSAPGVHFGDNTEARKLARNVNEYVADVVRDNPNSFGLFATLPLPDVDGALEEAVYALDELHVDGVVLLANHGGIYLGDARFEPLFAELGRRGAVVFVHPNELPAVPVPGVPAFAADFLLDTTRAAMKLATSGTLERYPNLRIILSHGGGFLPYIIDRIARFKDPTDPDVGRALLRRFYFDVAIASGPSALPSLLAFADPTHLTYGSDSPFAPAPVISHFIDALNTYPVEASTRQAIERGNAEALFPRLAPSPASRA